MEHFPGVGYALGYQSKVGPTKWLDPFTQDLLEFMKAIEASYYGTPIT